MAVYSAAGFPPCALWDYSIKLYSDAVVSEACLALQIRLEIDVNLVLFCLWVAASGRETLTESELDEGMKSSSGWQSNVVEPLRSLRNYLKSPEDKIDNRLVGDLRRVVADSEIYSERLELLMLEKLIDRPVTSSFGGQDCADAAAENLKSYILKTEGVLSEQDRKDFMVIWSAAFPTADPQGCVLMAEQSEMELGI